MDRRNSNFVFGRPFRICATKHDSFRSNLLPAAAAANETTTSVARRLTMDDLADTKRSEEGAVPCSAVAASEQPKATPVFAPTPAQTPSWRSCRVCHDRFDPASNSSTSCRIHPESWAGETAQRWLAPGSSVGDEGARVHEFWTCCGAAERDAPGCCTSFHRTYDEPEDIVGRMPGM